MEVEKTIQFLLEQQAKFWTGLEEMRAEQRGGFAQVHEMFGRLITVADNLVEAQAGANERIDRLAESHLQMGETQRRLSEEMRLMAEAQRRLSEEMRLMAEAQRRLSEEMRLMAEAQRRADERMDALILVVNGMIRRDREKPQ